MPPPPYRFNYGEPGHFVEIYLPKKAQFQGILYRTLTEGFDLGRVRAHFLDRANDIQVFLQDHEEFRDFTPDQVDRLSPSYNGYSLYELDGVFRSRTMPAPNFSLCEERVQVIRLMFLPPKDLLADVEICTKDRQLAARRYIRFWTQDLLEYAADLDRGARADAERVVASKLYEWLKDVGLFLHGYILFKLCETIHDLSKEAQSRVPNRKSG